MTGDAHAPLDSSVLGQILLLQSALQAAPDEERLAEMVAQGLSTLPGVASAVVSIDGTMATPGGPTTDPVQFALRTERREYGVIELVCTDREELTPYEPFVANTANFVALFVESKRHEHELVEMSTDLELRAEERTREIRESEDRLKRVLYCSNDGWWDWDPKDDSTFYSDRFWEIFGYARDDLPSDSSLWFRLIHPDDADRVERFVDDAFAADSDRYEVECRLRHRDGHWIPVLSKGYLVRDPEGTVTRVYGITIDLTRQKQTEEKLRLQSLVLDQIKDRVTVTDLDGVITYVNDAEVESLGYTREELIGASTEIYGDDAARGATQRQIVDETLRRGTWRSEVVNRRADGEEIFLDCRTQVVYDEHGEKVALAGIATDITERKKMEAELRESEERNRAFVSALPDMLFRFDGESRFLDCYSNQPEELLIPPEQTIGKSAHDLLPAPLAEQTERMIHEALRTGRMQKYSYSLGIGSEERFYESRMVPVHRHEVLAIVRDITDVRRAEHEKQEMERRVQQTQKLESLGVLAGGIAHDFNNLLMSILGHADLALDELSPTSPARANIESIETASRRAADLCSQMLAYSGKGRFVIEPFDVSTLVEEMAHLLKTSISKKALLNLQTEKNLPKVEGDATQIRQIVMNLVINASEAIGEQSGVISVSTGACWCGPDDLRGACVQGDLAESMYVTIEVTDTGCGMDQTTLDRLFEPFFTTKFVGRGLGMSAVLGIVRGHRGALTVESTVGAGTTFRVFLPPSAVPEATPKEKNVADNDAKPHGVILLVDDEESIRTLGRKMLERIGFEVITASDGREALEVYRREQERIDLVLLDLTMPRMDGAETLRELKRIAPEVRIVMASGYSDCEIEARLTGEGLLGAIQKPYTMAQLRERLYPVFGD